MLDWSARFVSEWFRLLKSLFQVLKDLGLAVKVVVIGVGAIASVLGIALAPQLTPLLKETVVTPVWSLLLLLLLTFLLCFVTVIGGVAWERVKRPRVQVSGLTPGHGDDAPFLLVENACDAVIRVWATVTATPTEGVGRGIESASRVAYWKDSLKPEKVLDVKERSHLGLVVLGPSGAGSSGAALHWFSDKVKDRKEAFLSDPFSEASGVVLRVVIHCETEKGEGKNSIVREYRIVYSATAKEYQFAITPLAGT